MSDNRDIDLSSDGITYIDEEYDERIPDIKPSSFKAAFIEYIKKHSIGLLTIITGASVTLFIHFDNKHTEAKSEQESTPKVSTANHYSPPSENTTQKQRQPALPQDTKDTVKKKVN